MTNKSEKVCPRCHVAQPADAWTDLPTKLCRMCVADLMRGAEQ